MSDSVKESAIIFKKRAKELGYEIKLTHCQELLARINGHKTRHSHLLANKTTQTKASPITQVLPIDAIPKTKDVLGDFIDYLVSNSSSFSAEELELIKSKDFQKEIEQSFLSSLFKTVESVRLYKVDYQDSEIIELKEDLLAKEYIFDFELNKWFFNNVKKIIGNLDNSSYSLEKYLDRLDKHAFRDVFFLGLIQKENKVEENLRNYFNAPNAIFLGAMGSGKTVSNVFTCTTWMLANSDQSIMYIVDCMKAANDYQQLFSYNQVLPILDELKFKTLIDDLYEEAQARKNEFNLYQAENTFDYEKKSGKKLARILVVMEEFSSLIGKNILNFKNEYKTDGSHAFKFYQLMRIGRSLGIWFNASTQKGTKADIPSELVPNFAQKQVFRVSKTESMHFMGNSKASSIRTDQKGRCQTDYGTVQFPYMSHECQKSLLKKYMKPLSANLLHIKKNI